VDSHGREVGYLRTQHAKPGRISADHRHRLQRTRNWLWGRQRAVVAMDPRNGEILALVSHPATTQRLRGRINHADWDKLITNPTTLMNKPSRTSSLPIDLQDHHVRGRLQEGVAQNMRVNCQGGADFYGRSSTAIITWRAGYQRRHSGVVRHLLLHAGSKAGIDTIAKYATEFGLGQKTGIDLPNEMAGIMPPRSGR